MRADLVERSALRFIEKVRLFHTRQCLGQRPCAEPEQALLLDRSLAMDADYSDTHAIRAFCLWHRELLFEGLTRAGWRANDD